MIRRLTILLLIVGCEELLLDKEDVYGCTDSNAINYLPNAVVSDSTCEYSIYGYPDFETICGMDEFGNPLSDEDMIAIDENWKAGDGICGLCIGERDSVLVSMLIFGDVGTHYSVSPTFSSPYPNPFGGTTSIQLGIGSETYTTIYILNTDYNMIDTLIQDTLHGGSYTLLWNASKFPSGYYRIVADFGDVECFQNAYIPLDCAGIVSGDTVEDECGECGGNGAEESEVVLWGECYSIEATTDLDLSGGLWYYGYRTIPKEIGSLTNLTTLNLSHNQLTELPEEICDIYSNLSEFDVSYNRICGTLPSCLTVDDIGEQNCP